MYPDSRALTTLLAVVAGPDPATCTVTLLVCDRPDGDADIFYSRLADDYARRHRAQVCGPLNVVTTPLRPTAHLTMVLTARSTSAVPWRQPLHPVR